MPVRLTMGQLAVDMRLTADETDDSGPIHGNLDALIADGQGRP